MARPSVQATPEQWQRVASLIRERRLALGLLSQDQAVMAAGGMLTRSVWSIAESAGQRRGTMAESSLRGICTALRWTPDSIQRILAGKQPELAAPPTTSRLAAPATGAEAGVEVLKAVKAWLDQHERRLTAIESWIRHTVESTEPSSRVVLMAAESPEDELPEQPTPRRPEATDEDD